MLIIRIFFLNVFSRNGIFRNDSYHLIYFHQKPTCLTLDQRQWHEIWQPLQRGRQPKLTNRMQNSPRNLLQKIENKLCIKITKTRAFSKNFPKKKNQYNFIQISYKFLKFLFPKFV